MSSRQMSWASRADRLLPATGPVSDRQYPMRIGADTVGMSAASTPSEKLHFPSEGHAAGTAVLGKNARQTDSRLRARPVALPLTRHGEPGDRNRAGGDHAAHGHVMGFHRDTARGVVTMNAKTRAFVDHVTEAFREQHLARRFSANE